jgi:hypothetical protein
MTIVRTALLATAACLLSASALAQTAATDTPNTPPAVQPGPSSGAATQSSPMQSPSSMPAMDQQGAQPAPAAPTGSPTDTSATIGPNGVEVVASPPVPDTPANRAAFGQPLSHAGKETKPVGN